MTDGRVREAESDELPAVLGVLDGAALETDADRVDAAIDCGDVLVAESLGSDSIAGSLVLDGREIANVAVRRRRRGQGIGTALVEAAADRRERLVAECHGEVVPFYEALGFDVAPLDEDDRYRGVRE